MLKYKISGKHLNVSTNIFFDKPMCFCGQTWIHLHANKEEDIGWHPCTIAIGIRDQDDFDVGFVYQANENNFEDILRELVNWMIDHENGISSVDNVFSKKNMLEFFPDLDCPRVHW